MGGSQSRQPPPSSLNTTPLSEPSDVLATPSSTPDHGLDSSSSSFHRGRESKRGRSAAASLSSMASLARGKRRKSTEDEPSTSARGRSIGSGDVDMTPLDTPSSSSLRPDEAGSSRPRSSRPSSFVSTRTDSSRGGTLSRAISRLRPTSMSTPSSSPYTLPPLSPSTHITPSLPTSPGPPVLNPNPAARPPRPSTPYPEDTPPPVQEDQEELLNADVDTIPFNSLRSAIVALESALAPQIAAIFPDVPIGTVERTSSANLIRLSDYITATRAVEGRNEEHEAMHMASARLLRMRLRWMTEQEAARIRDEERRQGVQAEITATNDALAQATVQPNGTQDQATQGPQAIIGPNEVPRVPAGAVLVIQGLVQTHQLVESESEQGDAADGSPNSDTLSLSRLASDDSGTVRSGSTTDGASSRPRRSRRLASRRGSRGTEQEAREASLEAQVRTIGNLVNVAAAAISTTLLTPENSPHPRPRQNRPSIANTITSFFERFRPGRRNVNVEAAISNYLRNALRNSSGNYTNSDASTLPSTNADGSTLLSGENGHDLVTHVSEEFRGFLEGLQRDLVESLNEFARPIEANEEEAAAAEDSSTSAAPPSEDTAPRTPTPVPGGDAIPTFHAQSGQTSSTPQVRSSVTGGTDGRPRRLNYFRAHLFPAVRASDPSTPARPGDIDGMVPCVFIGVQSINPGRNMTTEEMINHPAFPFIDGQVPADTAPTPAPIQPTTILSDLDPEGSPMAEAEPLQAQEQPDNAGAAGGSGDITSFLNQWSDPDAPRLNRSTPADAPPRTLRSRLGRIMSPRAASPPAGPTHTYLVYVIGGNYPANHPILRIPALMTGEPLSDEDMTLIGELLGSVKPPVASREEIEKAGLKIVKGDEMEGLGKGGEVLENCVERCLVCLSEYEPADECRILKCRHAYHKDCVDQWLSQGRNSCPACRTEAVVKSAAADPAEPPSQGDQSSAETAESAEGATDAEDSGTGYNTNLLDVD